MTGAGLLTWPLSFFQKKTTMTFEQIIQWITSGGILIGGISYLIGRKNIFSGKFTQGYQMAGSMLLSMAGIMSAAPTIAKLLRPVITPVLLSVGIDPSLISILLACDMGGYQLAQSLAVDSQVALVNGLVTSCLFGGTLTFTLPLALSLMDQKDYHWFSRGLLLGITIIPAGSITCSLLMHISAKVLLLNNIPVIIVSALLTIGFLRFPKFIQKLTTGIGDFFTKLGIVSIIIGSISYLIGFTVPADYVPLIDNMKIVCGVVIVLSGMLPAFEVIKKVLKRPLEFLGRRTGLDSASISGLLLTSVSAVPTMALTKEMNRKGLVLNGAWSVACAGTFGSQMSFIMNVRPEMLDEFVISKMIAGAFALLVSILYIGKASDLNEVKADTASDLMDKASAQTDEQPAGARKEKDENPAD